MQEMEGGAGRAAESDRGRELALAARCASGDRDAQRALFREQRERVHRTLYRIMGSNRHTEDLAQDAFIEVFRSVGGLRGQLPRGLHVRTAGGGLPATRRRLHDQRRVLHGLLRSGDDAVLDLPRMTARQRG